MEHDRRAVDPLIEIRTVTETGSTNTDMLALAAAGASEGLWLRAERQTAGRGRQGRKWVSPPGNLYASTLVRLRPEDRQASELSLVAAVALWETLDRELTLTNNLFQPGPSFHYVDWTGDATWPETSPGSLFLNNDLMLKWPNDLLLRGDKVAGILLERAGDAVVVGVGVNCATQPRHLDQPATCLRDHGVTRCPAQMLTGLTGIFLATLSFWRDKGLESVRHLWLERAHPIGMPIEVRVPDGTLTGTFDGMNRAGALILRSASGQQRDIYAGDVFPINGPPGTR